VEPSIDAVIQRLDEQLLTLSSDSKRIVAKTAGNNIQADDPQLVIDAINDVVQRVRKSQQPLDR
jgi:septum formation inhibitor-activating ATPase MinD